MCLYYLVKEIFNAGVYSVLSRVMTQLKSLWYQYRRTTMNTKCIQKTTNRRTYVFKKRMNPLIKVYAIAIIQGKLHRVGGITAWVDEKTGNDEW